MKELLELRRKGRIEEAYQGISRIYSKTKTPYTALALFWGADDMFRLRMKQGNTDAARHLLYEIIKVYPFINDNDLRVNRKIAVNALALDKALTDFNLAYFLPYFFRLPPRDWQEYPAKGYMVPSVGQQAANRLMARIPTCDEEYIQKVLPFFRFALSKNPANRDNLRHLAQLYARVGLKLQAVGLYKRLLKSKPESYLFAELAHLTDDFREKVILLTQAILYQKEEIYNVKSRYELAVLLREYMPERAAYEIRKSIAIREARGQNVSNEVERIERLLSEYHAVTEEDEKDFYRRCSRLAMDILDKK